MRLAISNIAWTGADDSSMYDFMRELGFEGLEIAPTRVIPEAPYDHLTEAAAWRGSLEFAVPSMQSIWFGRGEKLFAGREDRAVLLDYTRKAILFAQTVGCPNLVFGCPRNRSIPDGADDSVAVEFFRELGEFALAHSTAIGFEANPPIYNTNYINTTAEALDLIDRVNSRGFLLNLDLGTMIENGEPLSVLDGRVDLINHVHISEPGLKAVADRELHRELRLFLERFGYDRYVSIEMGNSCGLDAVKESMRYVAGVFG